MTRVAHVPAPIRTRSGQVDLNQKGPMSKHKVVLESVTQEKKKLRSVISFKAEPPKGYTFIPAGNPELTNALKEFARKGNYEIYAVSTTPHQKAHDLSQQVHRIGFHFPSVVVAQVCAHYGVVLTSAGTVLAEDESQSFHPHSQWPKNATTGENPKDQITINTEARDTIRDLFPNIPDNDLNQIIKTAFQKGRGKVGTAVELSLIRRAQLAVVAHIRHVYTDYDKLLRQTHYRDARNLVEKPTLRRLVQWRGDDENGKQALEDVFREVVVISDDDDSEEEDDDVDDVRDVSVEIVSSNTRADHLEPDLLLVEDPPKLYGRGNDRISNAPRRSYHESVGRPTRKERLPDKDKLNRRGFSRYQAWNEAREEYRADAAYAPTDSQQPTADPIHKETFRRPIPPAGDVADWHARSDKPLRQQYQDEDVALHYQRLPPETFRSKDGALYERIIPHASASQENPYSRQMRYSSRLQGTNQKVRTVTDSRDDYTRNDSQGLEGESDAVLPSIEGPYVAAAVSPGQAVSLHRSSHPLLDERRGIPIHDTVESRIDGIEFLDLTEEHPPLPKRRRMHDENHIVLRDPVARSLAQSLPSRKRESKYISLLSPLDRHVQPVLTEALAPLRSTESHYRGTIPLSESPYTPIQTVTQPAASRAGGISLDRPLAGKPPNLSHVQLYGDVYQPTLSPRVDEESIPSPRQYSALPSSSTTVDRGIQEYRAFRARERQDRSVRSPPGRGRRKMVQNEHSLDDFPGLKAHHPKQVAGLRSPLASSQQLPSPGVVPELIAVDDLPSIGWHDKYRLTRDQVAGPMPVRQRSASPTSVVRRRLEYLPLGSSTYLRQPAERRLEYVPVTAGRLSSREDSLGPVMVSANGRYDQRAHSPARFLPADWEDGGTRPAGFQRTYAQL